MTAWHRTEARLYKLYSHHYYIVLPRSCIHYSEVYCISCSVRGEKRRGQVTFISLKRKYIKFIVLQPLNTSWDNNIQLTSLQGKYSCPWLFLAKYLIPWEAAEQFGKLSYVQATLREMACLKHSGLTLPPGRSALSRLTSTFWWHSLMLTGYLALSSS